MHYRIIGIIALFSAATLSACLRDDCSSERTYVRFDPVYKTEAEIRTGITSESPRSLQNPGKIYALGHYLFINEKQAGIHVVDNSDPNNPQTIAFWNIPGNVDMAIRGQYLYADQYFDLLTIDISDMQQPQLVCRAEDVFPLFGFDPANGYIVDYKQTTVTETLPCDDNRSVQPWFFENNVFWVDFANFDGGSPFGVLNGLPSRAGIAGSFARFGLADQFLYTVETRMLRSWSLANPSCPVKSDSVWLGWNAETIFPWKDRLFVGSQTGVFIFNNSDPGHPVLEASFNHASGCDPVVCDDTHAYVTIHDGTTCNGSFNQLDVIGIQNLPSASLLKTYPMKRPFGLSITNEHLFLCDDGLKIFDKTNPLELKELAHLKGISTYDVIAFSDSHLLLIGDDGFFQFDVSDPKNPKQLSLIPVAK